MALGILAEPAQAGGLKAFVDVTEALGLAYSLEPAQQDNAEADFRNPEDGGLALADIDGDGRLELYVAHGRRGPGRLFGWNGVRFAALPGNGGIAPAAPDRAGYFLDLDDDGYPDFLSIQAAGAQVFRNDGEGRFEEMREPFGIRENGSLRSLAAADYDGDGDLDLILAPWGMVWSPIRPPSGYFWRNDGRGRFEDVSASVPLRPDWSGAAPYARSFTPVFADIDADGDPDLLLAGDYGASQVLRNDGAAGFTDIGGAAIDDENGMGAAAGDYDGDGDIDWFVTSIFDADGKSGFGPSGNRLYRNRGDGGFEDATEAAGVREGGWGWGACFADFDNDGHRDLFLTNGWNAASGDGEDDDFENFGEFLADPSRLFMSNGDGSFTERAAALGVEHTGQGRGVVCADYDGDGGVDILIANHGGAPTVYANALETGNRWLAVDLAGRRGNPQAIGARVTVSTGARRQMQETRLGGSYLSQAPATLHFGLGRHRGAVFVEVRWPGPGSRVSRLEVTDLDRRVTIREPAPGGSRLSVVRGSGSGVYPAGVKTPIAAGPPFGHYRFSHWTVEGASAPGDPRSPRTLLEMADGPSTAFAHFLPGPPLADPDITVARRWIEALLQAIRDDRARPTVHARNLFHLSAAMYDVWAARSGKAKPWLFGGDGGACGRAAPGASSRRAMEAAIAHAAHRLVRHRFRRSPGARDTLRNADTLLAALGHESAAAGPAAAFGRCIADLYIARGLEDGANEAGDYRSRHYAAANPALALSVPGNAGLADPDRWQPLDLEVFVDQAGFVSGGVQEFVTPEWGAVTPFALAAADLSVHRRGGADYRVYHDPGPPPAFRGALAEHYRWGFALVARWSSELSPDDGAMIDASPAGTGNAPDPPRHFRDYPDYYAAAALGPGRPVNPATGKPYEQQWVPRGDYARVVAEFWADGPDSETPPGHWFAILNAVNDDDRLMRRFAGEGPALDPLEWDIKAYFTLGAAMHDAAIAAWALKGRYDYIRPVSAIRAMADGGMATIDGIIETVGADDPLVGANREHEGKLKLLAWQGPPSGVDPRTRAGGVGWVLAEDWRPYQRPDFVTPPFAGYVSGHSTFSRAAAEVLAAVTGDPFFPGGMGEFPVPANDFLSFERGPSVDMTLQWATYRDAADQSSLSRIWGGIHPPADDIPGRLVGAKVGRDAFRLARSLFEGRR